MTQISTFHTADRLTWTTFSSANDGLHPDFIKQSYELGRFIGEQQYNYCYGGDLCGLMGEVFRGVDAARKDQNCPYEEKSRIIAAPYHLYYKEEYDPQFCEVHVKYDLQEQQKFLRDPATHIVALPGGIGTRGEIMGALTELRHNKGDSNKHLWLVNIKNAYSGFQQDIDAMLEKGFAKESDFSNMHFVSSIDELKMRCNEVKTKTHEDNYSPLQKIETDLIKCDNLLIAMPGDIEIRTHVWTALEELRCNKEFADKQLIIVNQDHCYEGLLKDMIIMMENGTAKPRDFERLRIANDISELKYVG